MGIALGAGLAVSIAGIGGGIGMGILAEKHSNPSPDCPKQQMRSENYC